MAMPTKAKGHVVATVALGRENRGFVMGKADQVCSLLRRLFLQQPVWAAGVLARFHNRYARHQADAGSCPHRANKLYLSFLRRRSLATTPRDSETPLRGPAGGASMCAPPPGSMIRAEANQWVRMALRAANEGTGSKLQPKSKGAWRAVQQKPKEQPKEGSFRRSFWRRFLNLEETLRPVNSPSPSKARPSHGRPAELQSKACRLRAPQGYPASNPQGARCGDRRLLNDRESQGSSDCHETPSNRPGCTRISSLRAGRSAVLQELSFNLGAATTLQGD